MCNMLPYVKFMNNNINTFDCNNYSDNLTDSHGVPLNESEVAGAIKGNHHDVLIETKLYLKRCSKVTLTILSHLHNSIKFTFITFGDGYL